MLFPFSHSKHNSKNQHTYNSPAMHTSKSLMNPQLPKADHNSPFLPLNALLCLPCSLATHKHRLPSLCKAQAYLLCLPCQSSLSSFHGRALCSRPKALPHTVSAHTKHAHHNSPVALIPIEGPVWEHRGRRRARDSRSG